MSVIVTKLVGSLQPLQLVDMYMYLQGGGRSGADKSDSTQRPLQGVEAGRPVQRLDTADAAMSPAVGYEVENAVPNCRCSSLPS